MVSGLRAGCLGLGAIALLSVAGCGGSSEPAPDQTEALKQNQDEMYRKRYQQGRPPGQTQPGQTQQQAPQPATQPAQP